MRRSRLQYRRVQQVASGMNQHLISLTEMTETANKERLEALISNAQAKMYLRDNSRIGKRPDEQYRDI